MFFEDGKLQDQDLGHLKSERHRLGLLQLMSITRFKVEDEHDGKRALGWKKAPHPKEGVFFDSTVYVLRCGGLVLSALARSEICVVTTYVLDQKMTKRKNL